MWGRVMVELEPSRWVSGWVGGCWRRLKHDAGGDGWDPDMCDAL